MLDLDQRLRGGGDSLSPFCCACLMSLRISDNSLITKLRPPIWDKFDHKPNLFMITNVCFAIKSDYSRDPNQELAINLSIFWQTQERTNFTHPNYRIQLTDFLCKSMNSFRLQFANRLFTKLIAKLKWPARSRNFWSFAKFCKLQTKIRVKVMYVESKLKSPNAPFFINLQKSCKIFPKAMFLEVFGKAFAIFCRTSKYSWPGQSELALLFLVFVLVKSVKFELVRGVRRYLSIFTSCRFLFMIVRVILTYFDMLQWRKIRLSY